MIRPAYWTDADLHTRLTAEVREFYIGLWMMADDGGYIAWDVTRVGAELYPFRSQAWRLKRLPAMLADLREHARLLDCGVHVLVPTLSRHQSPPKPSYQNQRAHDGCRRQQVAAGANGHHVAPAGTSTGREGVGKGLEGGASARDEDTTEFSRRVPRPS
jgi:hypothetical protein